MCELESRQKIQEFITENIVAKKKKNMVVDYETNLMRSGLFDSMSLMTLVNFLESQFEIHVPLDDFNITNFVSITAMAAYIEKKKNA